MTQISLIAVALLSAAAIFLLAHYVGVRIEREITPPEELRKRRATQRVKRPYIWTLFVARVEPFVPKGFTEKVRRSIIMAGGLEGMTPAEIMLYAIVSVVLGTGAGLLVVVMTGWSAWIVLALLTVGILLPFIWLRDQVKKRHLEILTDMPFHLDLLTLSVEAGLDFGAAVARMVEKGKAGPLLEEFNSFLGEIRMGKTRAESLGAMAERVGMPALSSFLASLVQADRLGTGLGQTLRLQADQLRVERFQRAETKAGEAPVKMLLPLVLFIFPTIWIILAAPLVFEWIFKGVL